jgi:hypothetical protein
MRERAVRSVQRGESPEVVARVIGVNRSTVVRPAARRNAGRTVRPAWEVGGERVRRSTL